MERTPQEIYSTENNQKLSYFYTSNRIISSPEVVFDFFLHFERYSVEKIEKFLKDLILALRTVSTNAYILNRQERRAKKGYYRDLLEGKIEYMKVVMMKKK